MARKLLQLSHDIITGDTIKTMARLLTLCVVRRDGKLLLGMKKRGFGEGYWNGFGGKLEPGESLETAARRELREEAGIEALSLAPAGVMRFAYEDGTEEREVRVFAVDAFDGEPTESEEMRPAWFASAELPFERMWKNDRHWYPYFLAGTPFRGQFRFDTKQGTTLLSHEIAALPTGVTL